VHAMAWTPSGSAENWCCWFQDSCARSDDKVHRRLPIISNALERAGARLDTAPTRELER